MCSTPTAAPEAILMLPSLDIYIEGETKQVTYWLNCSGECFRAILGHSKVFEQMTDEWPSLLASRNKIVPIIAFGRKYGVQLPPRSSWLSQKTTEPSNGVRAGCFRGPWTLAPQNSRWRAEKQVFDILNLYFSLFLKFTNFHINFVTQKVKKKKI
jgi:hypothetical protein